MTDSGTKKYPLAPDEISSIFGMNKSQTEPAAVAVPTQSTVGSSATNQNAGMVSRNIPADLPVVGSVNEPQELKPKNFRPIASRSQHNAPDNLPIGEVEKKQLIPDLSQENINKLQYEHVAGESQMNINQSQNLPPIPTKQSGEVVDQSIPLSSQVPASWSFSGPAEKPSFWQRITGRTMGSKPNIEASGDLDARAGNKIWENALAFPFWSYLKIILPILGALILILILGYRYYTGSFSLSAWKEIRTPNIGLTKTPEEKQVETRETKLAAKQEAERNQYNTWIRQFFYEVNDTKITSMETDVSGNGLNNFEKYLLNLNPKMYDTAGTGVPDGKLIIDNVNPWTGQALSTDQQKLVDDFFNKEAINNRLAGAWANSKDPLYAPYVSQSSPYYTPGVTDRFTPFYTTPGQASTEPVAANTDSKTPQPPATPSQSPPPSSSPQTPQPVAPTPQPGQTSAPVAPPRTAPAPVSNAPVISAAAAGEIDVSKPGRVQIPSKKVDVPLVWTQSTAQLEADLKKGVVHYPGTALPGQSGTSYISGHSSGYTWDNNQYKLAFAKLNEVADGSEFYLTATTKTGKQVKFVYKVGGRAIYNADDPAQFLQTSESVAALSTCWPLNTNQKRLVLYGKLLRIE